MPASGCTSNWIDCLLLFRYPNNTTRRWRIQWKRTIIMFVHFGACNYQLVRHIHDTRLHSPDCYCRLEVSDERVCGTTIALMIMAFVCLVDECYAWVDDNISENIKWKVWALGWPYQSPPPLKMVTTHSNECGWVTWQRSISLRLNWKCGAWTLHGCRRAPGQPMCEWSREIENKMLQFILCTQKS